MKNIIIIGSGLAGSTLANLLINRFHVTILEKGSDEISIPPKNYIKRKLGDSITYCHGTGGTTNLWHNGLITLPPSDDGSVFSEIIKSLDIYTDKAACLLKFPGSYTKERETQLIYYYDKFKAIDISNKLDTILVPKCQAKINLDERVKIYHDVTNINYNFINDNTINSIDILTKNNNNYKLKADYIIICAGGIGTPTVVSNILESKKIPANSLGDGFIDHPMGFIGKIKVKKEYRDIFKDFVNKNHANYTSRCGIVIENNKYSHICYFRPACTMTNSMKIYKFKSFLGTSTLKEKIKCIFDKRFYHPDILLEVLMHFTSVQIDNGVYSLWLVFEQKKSDSKNSVIPNNDIDTINWEINKTEESNYLTAINDIKNKLLPFAEKINIVENNINDYLWSAAHHSGTISFGDNPENIDSNLKLNSISNVYICDGSVIQNHSYTNTGLTIAQLCCRLYDYLNDKENI